MLFWGRGGVEGNIRVMGHAIILSCFSELEETWAENAYLWGLVHAGKCCQGLPDTFRRRRPKGFLWSQGCEWREQPRPCEREDGGEALWNPVGGEATSPPCAGPPCVGVKHPGVPGRCLRKESGLSRRAGGAKQCLLAICISISETGKLRQREKGHPQADTTQPF